jgi:hypothetical protein
MNEDLKELIADISMKVLVGAVMGMGLQFYCKSKFGVY